MKKLFIAMAFVATPLVMSNAHAGINGEVTARVEVEKTDLTSSRGIVKTHKSISKSAQRACGMSHAKGLANKRSAKACAKNLATDMVQQVNNHGLTAYHNGKGQRVAGL